jgi:hypothetical protein
MCVSTHTYTEWPNIILEAGIFTLLETIKLAQSKSSVELMILARMYQNF